MRRIDCLNAYKVQSKWECKRYDGMNLTIKSERMNDRQKIVNDKGGQTFLQKISKFISKFNFLLPMKKVLFVFFLVIISGVVI